MVTAEFHKSPVAHDHAIFTLTGAGKSRQRNACDVSLGREFRGKSTNTCGDSAHMECILSYTRYRALELARVIAHTENGNVTHSRL